MANRLALEVESESILLALPFLINEDRRDRVDASPLESSFPTAYSFHLDHSLNTTQAHKVKRVNEKRASGYEAMGHPIYHKRAGRV